jgi:hydrophobic/amphiphilic exporter-1 (mainly G- bacteria), HAE1 family
VATAFIDHPVKVAVGVILLVMFGIIAATRMPLQLAPDVTRPIVNVSTFWPGASSHEVEEEIVNMQEEQLKGVIGVTRMTSNSSDSMGEITLEFAVGSNMQEALFRVNNALQRVREYPLTAEKPFISTSSNSDRSIAWYVLNPLPPSEEKLSEFSRQYPELADEVEKVRRAYGFNSGLAAFRLREFAAAHPQAEELLPPKSDEALMRKLAEEQLAGEFERVPGVARVEIRGGLDQEVQVIIDPDKLAGRGLTITSVIDVLRQQNRNISAGDVWEGKRRLIVRTLGQFTSIEQIGEQILTVSDSGIPVYVRDVAEVRMGVKKPDSYSTRYMHASVSLNVSNSPGANIFEVVKSLRDVMERLNKEVLASQGLYLRQVYDDTVYIESAINIVNQNIFLGSALTVITLMLFLHAGFRTLVFIPLLIALTCAAMFVSPWFFALSILVILAAGFWFARATLIVAVSIPVSIVGTFLVLDLLDRTLNVITLAGLAFAVGMLVDNSVVVLENIFRYYQSGESAKNAARKGIAEVWGAVLASTLTTLFVFLPVVFMPGEAGQLFADIALAIGAAVGLSLVISVIVIPTASVKILGSREHNLESGQSAAARWIAGVGKSVNGLVVAGNRWIQTTFLRRLALVVTVLGVSLGLAWLLLPSIEYLPSGNRNLVITRVILPPGYNLEHSREIAEKAEAKLRPWWDVDPENLPEGQPVISDYFCSTMNGMVFMGLQSADPARAGELVTLAREQLSDIAPGTLVIASQTSIFGRGLGGGREIDIEIVGPELTRLIEIGNRVMGEVQNRLGPEAQARPQPSLDLASPEVHIVAKPAQARQLGMSNSEIGASVDALVDGAYVGDYSTGGRKIDLVVLANPSDRSQSEDIERKHVATPGATVPVRLDSFVDVTMGSGPDQIYHSERERAISIDVTPPPEMSLEDAIETVENGIVRELIAEGELAGGYNIRLSGTADKLQQTWRDLRWNFLLALLITYLLMAALFESFLHPLVIIMTVPVGAVGGIIGLKSLSLWVVSRGDTPQNLDVLTMLGFIILVGTVVNNAILIVHQALIHMREDGMTAQDAVVESTSTRIRPIFMTTLTTVLGLAPLVFFPGAGSELYRGIGSVVLGGLVASTLVTLFLTPSMFTLAHDTTELWRQFTRRRVPGGGNDLPEPREETREETPDPVGAT